VRLQIRVETNGTEPSNLFVDDVSFIAAAARTPAAAPSVVPPRRGPGGETRLFGPVK
jgi:hypothetical protein